MNEWALATLAASSISTWSASGLPKSIFSLMVVANRAGSWLTSPICCLSHLSFKVFMSCPSSRTCPAQVKRAFSLTTHFETKTQAYMEKFELRRLLLEIWNKKNEIGG